MLTKTKLKQLYFGDFLVAIILCIASLFRFYQHLFSYLIGFLVVALASIGYYAVDRHYDDFYGKRRDIPARSAKKRS